MNLPPFSETGFRALEYSVFKLYLVLSPRIYNFSVEYSADSTDLSSARVTANRSEQLLVCEFLNAKSVIAS